MFPSYMVVIIQLFMIGFVFMKKIVTKIKNGEEKEKVDVKIIFRKQELAPTEMGFLEYLKYVRHGGA